MNYIVYDPHLVFLHLKKGLKYLLVEQTVPPNWSSDVSLSTSYWLSSLFTPQAGKTTTLPSTFPFCFSVFLWLRVPLLQCAHRVSGEEPRNRTTPFGHNFTDTPEIRVDPTPSLDFRSCRVKFVPFGVLCILLSATSIRRSSPLDSHSGGGNKCRSLYPCDLIVRRPSRFRHHPRVLDFTPTSYTHSPTLKWLLTLLRILRHPSPFT